MGQCAKSSHDLLEGGRGQRGGSVFQCVSLPEESVWEVGEGRMCLTEGFQSQDCLRIPGLLVRS